MRKEINLGGRTFIVYRSPSIYTNRSGREDCVVLRRNTEWGAREDDGHLYTTMIRLAAETGERLRAHEPLPDGLTLDQLRDWGFVETGGAETCVA